MNVRTRWIVNAAVAMFAIVGTVALCSAAETGASSTQPAAAPAGADGFPYVGHITGTNVRIRSGPDANYYPVGKFDHGAEVTVYAQQYGWLAIAPPPGCYSLIDREYVDKTADGVGVVNGDDVWVRAGSDIDSHRYAKQVKLRKGTELKLLGETSDGAFYKIVPPEGARLWVSAEFVSKGAGSPGARATLAADAAKPPKTGVPGSKEREAPPRIAAAKAPSTQPSSGAPFGKYASEITAIDASIKLESQKPLAEQNFKPLIDQLRPIAQQDEEPVAKLYAQRRIEQLEAKGELMTVIQEVATLQSSSEKEHQTALMARQSIKPPPETVIDGRVKAVGELRPSAVFDSRSAAYPKRYRIVDPANDKTVAYVELPAGSSIDVDQYFGKYVTVYAKERKLTSGTIQPLSVLLADEIRITQPQGFSPGMIELPNSASASGKPLSGPAVGGPTTRPVPATEAPASQPSEQ
ncbi:MAG: hypothetical protein ACPMAQ_15085 [Phycisphaerae bacterium]